jgi:peptide/nickel transport system permease protein
MTVLRKTPFLIWCSATIMIVLVLAGIFAPLIAPFSPDEQSLMERLAAPGTEPANGRPRYLLGTDQLGRDIFSRVLYGTRVSLGIGLAGMLIGFAIGTTLGLISGFGGKISDTIIMFLVDTQQALPFIVIALVGVAIFGTDLRVLVVLLGLAGWDTFARFARGMTLGTRNREYVVAAQLMGQSPARIMLRHILPNIAAPLIVLASLNLTSIIMLETSLSFLGLGVQAPTPSWGSMVGEGRQYLNSGAWWLAIVPGAAIVLTTTSINFLGDWLRDVLDPTLKEDR